MECLKYMDYSTFVDTFRDIYHKYKMIGDPTYAYYSKYPIEYTQAIQQLVLDDYTIAICFFKYIDKMIDEGKISEIEHRKIMNHAYFIFTGDFRDNIVNENEYDNIFKSVELLIDEFDKY